jgi:hypothetical protein
MVERPKGYVFSLSFTGTTGSPLQKRQHSSASNANVNLQREEYEYESLNFVFALTSLTAHDFFHMLWT